MGIVLAIFWIILNSILLVFVLNDLYLLVYALIGRKHKSTSASTPEHLPSICVQLPIYNEKFVVKELLDSITKLEYPTERLHIQILDDSTDETSDIIANYLESTAQHLNISHIRRGSRDGFKAGALAHGMTLTEAPYFAIFDADFRPQQDFLVRAISQFTSKEIGVVQTRWGYTNEGFSILTQAEGLMLDTHFGIEQLGRCTSSNLLNFNGTAGIWKRACIDDAGGWQGDTLTEDLDLSYRAQVKGWKINFVFDVVSPSELPQTFKAYRNQQFRWSKGAAECFRKNIGLLWNSSVTFGAKIEGSLHLLNSSLYLVTIGIISIAPFIFFQNYAGSQINQWIPNYGIYTSMILLFVLAMGRIVCGKSSIKDILLFIPSAFSFLAFSIGISTHMAYGVIQAYLGVKSEFVRTPKFGQSVFNNTYTNSTRNKKSGIDLRWVELMYWLYGFFWLIVGIINADPYTILYSLLTVLGFSMSLFFSERVLSWRSKGALQDSHVKLELNQVKR